MSVVTGQERFRSRAARRRQELPTCLPTLRTALQRERAFRIQQLAELTRASRGRTGTAPATQGDPGDALRQVDAAVLAGARQALADIERALAAMRTGRYGRCEDCGGEIPLAVLRAVPRASLCLDCQSACAADEPVPVRRPHGVVPDPRDARHPRRSAGPPPSPAQDVSGGSEEGPEPTGPVPSAPSTLWVSTLLGQVIVGPARQHLGHVRDVVVHRTPVRDATLVCGLICDVGGREVYAPAATVRGWRAPRITLITPSLRSRCPHGRQDVRLAADVLGRPVLTATTSRRAPRITDVGLRRTAGGWAVSVVDTGGVVSRRLGLPRRLVGWEVLTKRRFAPTPAARRRPVRSVPDAPR